MQPSVGVERARISDTELTQNLLTDVTVTQQSYRGLLQLSGGHWKAIRSQKAMGGTESPLAFTPHSFLVALRFILPHIVFLVMIPLWIIPLWGHKSNRVITIWATVLLQIPPCNSANRQTRTSGKIILMSKTLPCRVYLRKGLGLAGPCAFHTVPGRGGALISWATSFSCISFHCALVSLFVKRKNKEKHSSKRNVERSLQHFPERCFKMWHHHRINGWISFWKC